MGEVVDEVVCVGELLGAVGESLPVQVEFGEGSGELLAEDGGVVDRGGCGVGHGVVSCGRVPPWYGQGGTVQRG
uniref:hypothetical protein n=1 Tax=Streptomyces sp. W75 TaxID=1170711 RepID=UPI001867264B|nr:hypothetical protein [Streptomyces sp. W75]